MAVTREDVVKVARLANIDLADEQLDGMVEQLSSILAHMEELGKVDTERVLPAEGLGSAGARLRADHGPSDGLAQGPAAFAPEMRDGFFIVPRLASHEGSPERSP